MNRYAKPDVVFSQSLEDICSGRFVGWIVHLLCLAGRGSFLHNGRRAELHRNHVAVISHPELVNCLEAEEGLQVEFVAAPADFIYGLLPANHYGVGGGVSLFDNPVMPLCGEEAERFLADIHNIRNRLGDREHMFYSELIGSLMLTMIYDLFEFHAKRHDGVSATERTAGIVRRLMALLEAGRCRQHRSVAYYAGELNVSAKYLSETVKRNTGRSVSYLIDRHTIPVIADYLKNSDLSLTQICEELNFSSLSYFSRYVHKHLGMTPSRYRAAYSPVGEKQAVW